MKTDSSNPTAVCDCPGSVGDDFVPAFQPQAIGRAERLDLWLALRSHIKELSMIGCALLALVWSLKESSNSTRLILVPAALVCPWISPPVGLALLVLGYLVPQTVLGGPTVSALPFVLAIPMVINSLPLRRNASQFVVPPLTILAFAVFVVLASVPTIAGIKENFYDRDRLLAFPFFVLALWQYRKNFDKFLVAGALIAGGVAFSGWTIWKVVEFGGIAAFDRGLRVKGEAIVDPNYLACWIGLGFIPVLGLLLQWPRTKWQYLSKIPLVGVLAIMTYALGAGASRGIGAALLGAALIMFLLQLGAKPLALVGGVLGMAALIPLLWNLSVFDVYRDRVGEGIEGGDRLDLAVAAVDHWLEAPFAEELMGNGAGSTYGILGKHSHNTFTEALLDFGLIGFILFIVILGLAWRSALLQTGVFRLISLGWLTFLVISGLSISPFFYIWGWQVLALVIPVPRTTLPQPLANAKSHLSSLAGRRPA